MGIDSVEKETAEQLEYEEFKAELEKEKGDWRMEESPNLSGMIDVDLEVEQVQNELIRNITIRGGKKPEEKNTYTDDDRSDDEEQG